MLDNFDKAETLSFLWAGTDRTMGQAAVAGILAAVVLVCARAQIRITKASSSRNAASCDAFASSSEPAGYSFRNASA